MNQKTIDPNMEVTQELISEVAWRYEFLGENTMWRAACIVICGCVPMFIPVEVGSLIERLADAYAASKGETE